MTAVAVTLLAYALGCVSTGYYVVRFPRLRAFAVELAAGPLSRGGVRRHVAAVLAMATQ